MILYLSGPITGNPLYGYQFSMSQMNVNVKGHTALNPAHLPKGLKAYDDYMKIGLSMLDAADGIVMLEGWKKSNGARIELRAAIKAGKKIYFGVNSVPQRDETQNRAEF